MVCRIVFLRSLLAGLILALPALAGARPFETINRIKHTGTVRAAVLPGEPQPADTRMLEGLARSLGADLETVVYADPASLLAALGAGEVDLVGQPLAVGRPLPDGLIHSRPLRHGALWLVTSAAGRARGTLGIRFGSDAWYAALDRREALADFPIRVADARWRPAELLDELAEGRFAAALVYQHELAQGNGRRVGLRAVRPLAEHLPLAWVLRDRDRVLAHRVNRHIETAGLTRDVVYRDRADWAGIEDRGRLRLVTLYRPESYFAWNGQLLGLDYELVADFARRNGLGLDVVLAEDLADLRRRLLSGEADLAAALLRPDQLGPGLAASAPYLEHNAVLVARSGRFQRLEPVGLHGHRLALPADSPFRHRLEAWRQAGVGMQLEEASDDPERLVARLLEGGTDFIVLDRLRFELERRARPGLEAVMALDVPVERVWAVRAGNPSLKSRVDRYFAHRRGSLDFNLVLRRYHGHTANTEFLAALEAFYRDRAISPYDALVRRYAAYYGFDWRLILAQIFQESRFDPGAVSVSGARGLMQVKAVAARQVGVADLHEPRHGIHAGLRYLSWLRDQFETDLDVSDRLWFALAAYNGGLTHLNAARRHAAALGLDPRRWFGHVETALAALPTLDPARHGGLDVGQVTGYVRAIRERYRLYVHLAPESVATGERVARAEESPTAPPAEGALGALR